MIDDFRDLLRELVGASVQFLVVVAHALSVQECRAQRLTSTYGFGPTPRMRRAS